MLVAEIIKDKGEVVYVIRPDIRLSDACAELDRWRVGALVVCDEDNVVGVLSERDVVRAVARDGDAALTRPIGDYMTREVVFAAPTEAVGLLMSRMTEKRIRHLPVMAEGRLSGVVSIGDVVKCQIAEAAQEAESLRTYIAGG